MTERITDVEALRRRIDVLDAEIVALLVRRQEVSRAIQQARADAGDGPVSPERESAIGDRYAAALGNDGREVATAILVVCRGRY